MKARGVNDAIATSFGGEMMEISWEKARLSICDRLTKTDFELQGRVVNRLPKDGHAKGCATNKHPDSLSIAIRSGCPVSYRRISPAVALLASSRKGPRARIRPTNPPTRTTNQITKRVHVNAPAANTRVSRELNRRPT